jgi:hypothetical protein
VNAGTHPARRETEQPASTARVKETAAAQAGDPQHRLQRSHGAFDLRLVEAREKTGPVPAELEALARLHFPNLISHVAQNNMELQSGNLN